MRGRFRWEIGTLVDPVARATTTEATVLLFPLLHLFLRNKLGPSRAGGTSSHTRLPLHVVRIDCGWCWGGVVGWSVSLQLGGRTVFVSNYIAGRHDGSITALPFCSNTGQLLQLVCYYPQLLAVIFKDHFLLYPHQGRTHIETDRGIQVATFDGTVPPVTSSFH